MEERDKQKSFKIGNDDIDDVEQTITRILEDAGTDGVALMDSQNSDWKSFEESSDAIQSLIQEDGNDKYLIGGVLARGGMGMVFNAKDVNIRRKIAMKVMLPGRDTSTEQVVRFIEEAQITGQLEHPGIVPVYELGVDPAGNVFYTMKLIKGHTLMEVLDGLAKGDDDICSTYTLNHLLNIFLKVCDAVAYANSKRVVHRDLKPDNIMIGEYGEVSVLDWGLAKVLKSTSGSEQPLVDMTDITDDSVRMREAVNSLRQDDSHKSYETHYGLIMGTPRFMAPEQALGRTDEIDAKTDVYALGAILYNILTLHSPVTGKTVKEQLMNVINGNVPSPLEYGAEGTYGEKTPLHHCPEGSVPTGLAAVTLKAMAVRKGERYESVKQLQTEIDAWQNGYATDAEGAGTGRVVELFVKRHKPILSVAAASALIIFGLVIAFAVNAKLGERKALGAQATAEKAWEVAEKARLATSKSEEKLRAMSIQAAGLALDKALLHMKTHNLPAALDNIELSIKLDPSNPQAWFTKGRIELMQLKFNAAERSMKTYRKMSEGKQADDYLSVIGKFRAVAAKEHKLVLADYSLGEVIAQVPTLKERSFKRSTEKSGSPTAYKSDVVSRESMPEAKKDDKVLNFKTSLVTKEGEESAGSDADLDVAITGSVYRFNSLLPQRSANLLDMYAETMAKHNDPVVAAHFYNIMGDRQKTLKMQAREATRAIRKQNKAESNISVQEIDSAFLKVEIGKGSTLMDFSALQGLPIKSLDINECDVGDLKYLMGVPLEHLSIKTQQPIDLSSLNQIRLKSLVLNNPILNSLDCVKGMGLESLDISGTAVVELTPLKGMPLKKLVLRNTAVVDLTPVKGMALEEIDFSGSPVTNAQILLTIGSLKRINGDDSAAYLEQLRREEP